MENNVIDQTIQINIESAKDKTNKEDETIKKFSFSMDETVKIETIKDETGRDGTFREVEDIELEVTIKENDEDITFDEDDRVFLEPLNFSSSDPAVELTFKRGESIDQIEVDDSSYTLKNRLSDGNLEYSPAKDDDLTPKIDFSPHKDEFEGHVMKLSAEFSEISKGSSEKAKRTRDSEIKKMKNEKQLEDHKKETGGQKKRVSGKMKNEKVGELHIKIHKKKTSVKEKVSDDEKMTLKESEKDLISVGDIEASGSLVKDSNSMEDMAHAEGCDEISNKELITDEFIDNFVDQELPELLDIKEVSIDEIRLAREEFQMINAMSKSCDSSEKGFTNLKSEAQSQSQFEEMVANIQNEQIKREHLIKLIREKQNQFQSYLQYNRYLQGRLGEYYHRKKMEVGMAACQPADLNQIAAAEARYIKLLEIVNEYHSMRNELAKTGAEEIQSAKIQKARILKESQEKWEEYCLYRKQKLKSAIWAQSNKKMKSEEIVTFMQAETDIEKQLKVIRLKVIHSEQALCKISAEFHSYGSELESKGLKLIDFEQMRQESAVLRTKYEARCIEAVKLKNKVSLLNGTLSHFKESLKMKKEENRLIVCDVQKVNTNLDLSREHLNHRRIIRDGIKKKNDLLKEKTGLLGKESLLYDFEKNVLKLRSLKNKFKTIHNSYVETAKAIMLTRLQANIITSDNPIRDFTNPTQRMTIMIPTFNIINEEGEPINQSPNYNVQRRQSCLPTPLTDRPCRPSCVLPKNFIS